MQEYMLKVSKGAKAETAKWLGLTDGPSYVRISTLAPLSNWGYPPGTEGSVLKIHEHGVIMGLEDSNEAPHDFVPWQNIA